MAGPSATALMPPSGIDTPVWASAAKPNTKASDGMELPPSPWSGRVCLTVRSSPTWLTAWDTVLRSCCESDPFLLGPCASRPNAAMDARYKGLLKMSRSGFTDGCANAEDPAGRGSPLAHGLPATRDRPAPPPPKPKVPWDSPPRGVPGLDSGLVPPALRGGTQLHMKCITEKKPVHRKSIWLRLMYGEVMHCACA